MPVEDTILKILEARARGLDDRSTANEVGLSIFITTRYEKITKRTIKDAISNGALTLDEIARKVRLPRVVVDRFMSHYGISLPVPQPAAPEEKKKTVNWSLYREEQIRSAISSGAKNLDEIAQRAGL
ncbi:MAG TPA: hypothetical protein VI612_02695, partial [Candidatus Nanoarchaeia archaeon]|nr:hypothetical protein [Candidatus Nanoarchaeia archaeon]